MTQQTAIQWLQGQIEAFDPKMNTNEEYEWMFRQALDIEKEQIEKAFSDGQETPLNHPTLPMYSREEYYNDTFDYTDEISMKWKELKNNK